MLKKIKVKLICNWSVSLQIGIHSYLMLYTYFSCFTIMIYFPFFLDNLLNFNVWCYFISWIEINIFLLILVLLLNKHYFKKKKIEKCMSVLQTFMILVLLLYVTACLLTCLIWNQCRIYYILLSSFMHDIVYSSNTFMYRKYYSKMSESKTIYYIPTINTADLPLYSNTVKSALTDFTTNKICSHIT